MAERKTLNSRYSEKVTSVGIPTSTFKLAKKFIEKKDLKMYKGFGKLIEIGIVEATKNPKLLIK